MKRMTIALALLGFIVCTSFVTSDIVISSIDETCTALNRCTRTTDSQETEEAVSVWNRNKKILYAVMNHEDFFEIEKRMTVLEALSGYDDFSGVSRLCAETESLLRNKKEEIQVTFENVF